MNKTVPAAGKKPLKRRLKLVGLYLAAALLVIWSMVPILWMAYTSVIDKSELLTSGPLKLPDHFTFERYEQIFASFSKAVSGGRLSSMTDVFARGVINSVFVTVISTLLTLFVGGLAAYAFARLKFKGKNFMLLGMLCIQMLPTVALILPLYQMARALDLIDKLPILIVLYMSSTLAYAIWVLNGYYQSIPADLEAAARIDGCSYFSAFIRIVVPLAKPGFVAVGLLVFLMSWDELLYAMIFMTSKGSKTFTVAMTEFANKYGGMDYPLLMTAGCLITIIPMVLVAVFQRHIILGLTAGGVKN